MAEKLNFRKEEIEEAKRVIGEKQNPDDQPSDFPLEDIESTKSEIIKIPTEKSHTPDVQVAAQTENTFIRSVSRASRTSSRTAAAPTRAVPVRATTPRAATSRGDQNGSRLSVRSKSDHSEKLQRLQRCV